MLTPQNLCYNCFNERQTVEEPCQFCSYEHTAHSLKYPIALKAGSILNGRYIVGRVLGQGGFGITYLALDYNLKVKVAIKEYLPDSMATRLPDTTLVTVYVGENQENFDYGAERFLDEARVLAKFIGNRNIAGVKIYFNENNTSYFVMDYIEGISFKSYIQNKGGKIDYKDAVRVLTPVLRALATVHREGFIHRDVTPDNIYITRNDEIKLLDFGSARYSLGDKSKSLDVILKAGYAPKEQYFRRGKQGSWTDVYSIAACFYASITGFLPPESLERIDDDDIVAISARGVRIPAYLESAIMKGLEVKSEDRFQSAEEFLSAIESGRMDEASTEVQYEQPVSQYMTTQRLEQAQPIAEQSPYETQRGANAGYIKKNKAAVGIIAGAACVVLVVVAILWTTGGGGGQQTYSDTTPSSPIGEASSPETETSSSKTKEMVGNTPGNIANHSIVAQQGDWVYYGIRSDGFKLYKIRIDGTQRTNLNDDDSSQINVAGDWVYYCNNNDDSKLYRIRTDGTQRTKLNDDKSRFVNVVGDWIYYCNDNDNSKLYKIQTDGTQKTKLNDDNSNYVNVTDDWVYYSNDSDGGNLYNISTNGTKKTRLNDDYCSSVNVIGDWVYYNNDNDRGKIYKIRTDGTQRKKLNDDDSNYVNVLGDWIYYCNVSDGYKLYKIRTDGTQATKLSDDVISFENVVGDWVYYWNGNDESRLYKIRTDGTERQLVDAPERQPVDSMDETEITYGNTFGNTTNGGFVAQQGEWVYYSSNDSGKLYKIRADGTQRTKLNDDNSDQINVVGDWVYYRNYSDDYKLYKIRTDGTQRAKLNDDSPSFVNVVGDWIYYSDWNDDSKLYKIHTDGTGKTKLLDDEAWCPIVAGDWIYYKNKSDAGNLYKVRTDGTDKTMLNYDSSWDINVVGDWVYYRNMSVPGGTIFKIRNYGTDTDRTKLNNAYGKYLNVAGDWVYYIDSDNDNKLWKVRTDGTGETQVNNFDECENINVADDWVYYHNTSDDFKLYKIRTDGTNRQLVD